MGSIRKLLYKSDLPDRELHHSRLFVDLAENIHIHHREYRTVFSLDEYFEYADIIKKSTEDVLNFLDNNRDYQEGVYPTTIMIAGGKERQLKFLNNSPKPNESSYFANEFAIELQDTFVTDEVHIHYRDFRIACDRKRFREIARGFEEALRELDVFEESETYERTMHPDRIVQDYNINSGSESNTSTEIMGVSSVKISEIKSRWFEDILAEWHPDKYHTQALRQLYNKEGGFCPLLLSTETDGSHLIIDGHHRYYAALEMGLETIESVIIDLNFEETKELREAENLLKKFDRKTNYKYSVSSFLKSYMGRCLNRYYAHVFRGKMAHQLLVFRAIRKLKRIFFGKKYVFRRFNEAHNDY